MDNLKDPAGVNVIAESHFRAPDDGLSSENALDILGAVEINLSDQLTEPPTCLELPGKGYYANVATLGNFSLMKGKAKSRKSFAATILMAAAVRNGEIMDSIRGILPEGKITVLYFDTEQSPFHTQRMAERVTRMARPEDPARFRVFSLRKFTPAERLFLIESALYNIPGIGFVVIDGIRDLVTSINDEEQASATASHLMKWTEELGIHILVILHENKGNEFARGHLGSELVNKAETTLTIAKAPEDDNISVVEAEFCRDREPLPFAFSIDETGLPQLTDWHPAEKKNSVTPAGISYETHTKILAASFRRNDKLKYADLKQQIKDACGELGIKVGETKARDFLSYYLNKDMIRENGTARTRSAFYTCALNCANGALYTAPF